MERKTKEFVCECSDDVIVVGEGDFGECNQCGEVFAYHYESMETMYQDLIAYRGLAHKNWNNLSNISIQLNLILTAIKENKPFEEIRFNILQLREMTMQHMMTGLNELRFFYGKDNCEDCE
jgi:hypothetical protein